MFEIIYRYDVENPCVVQPPADAADARRRLEDGNRGFAHVLDDLPSGRGTVRRIIPFDPRDFGLGEAADAPPKQRPFAVVLGCSDARVPTELIFNQWCNELFVVRVAGNVLGADSLGSIDYAINNLGDSVKLLVVLAHSGCGAVTAAVDVFLKPAQYLAFATSHPLRTIIDRIVVVARGAARALELAWGADIAQRAGYRAALIEATVAMNAALTAFTLRRELAHGHVQNGLRAVYGVYDLGSRRVTAPDRAGVAGNGDELDIEIGLADPPTSLEDFAALAGRIAASPRLRMLLAPG
jgi:carbonic anhydrase